MTPDCRRWTEQMAERWAARAELLQDDPGASASQLLRAACLEDIVADLRRRLAASPPPAVLSADDARIAGLEERLARLQPYMHPTYRIMFNTGPIMAEVRAGIEAQLGRAPSVEVSVAPARPKWIDAPLTRPANDPEPFMAGPQMDMFG